MCDVIDKLACRFNNVIKASLKRVKASLTFMYNKRLAEFSALSLENVRHYTDMATFYKFLHGHVDFPASDVGLHVAASSTRDTGVHLAQRRARNCVSANLFPLRAATA